MQTAAEKLLYKDYILVPPCDERVLPTDAPAILRSEKMRDTSDPTPHDSPALAFLDHIANCRTNAAAIGIATRILFSSELPPVHTALLVGVPGLKYFCIPAELNCLNPLTAMAATSADMMGSLGNKPIVMVLSRAPRPKPLPGWHQDFGQTFLLCAEAVSPILALAGAGIKAGMAYLDADARLYSPLAGMPVAFANLIHTAPYEIEKSISKNNPAHSGMLVFYELAAGRRMQDYAAVGAPLINQIKKLNGNYPRMWEYA